MIWKLEICLSDCLGTLIFLHHLCADRISQSFDFSCSVRFLLLIHSFILLHHRLVVRADLIALDRTVLSSGR